MVWGTTKPMFSTRVVQQTNKITIFFLLNVLNRFDLEWREGFEPLIILRNYAGFQDWSHKLLGHLLKFCVLIETKETRPYIYVDDIFI